MQPASEFRTKPFKSIPSHVYLDQRYPATYTKTKAKQKVIYPRSFIGKSAFLYDVEPVSPGSTNPI